MAKSTTKRPTKKDTLNKLAHDMRTPLATIQMYLNLIAKEIKEERKGVHEASCRSLEKVKLLAESLKDLMPDTPAKKRVKKPNVTKCDIADLIRGVISELYLLAQDKGIRLTYIGPDHVIGTLNSLAFERVIQNLVKNATQAFHNGENRYIEVHLFQKNQMILIDVRDNGCGIAPENLDKIFQKGVTIGDHGGTGIGLAYCKEVIEKQGGTISVYSQVRRGTLFSIMLPIPIMAVGHLASSNRLQICAADTQHPTLQPWISRWQQQHKNATVHRVPCHPFMLDHGEDSIH